jgi:DNA-binding transcriptional MerR regulator
MHNAIERQLRNDATMSSDSPRADAASSLRPSPPAAIGAALSISVVAHQTGISVATLRMWQARYGLGPGLTTPGGHRRYTAGDVQRLRRVKHLVSEGLTTSEAVHAVLAAARSDLGLRPDADPVAHHLGAAALELDGPTARRLVDEHLRRGDVAATWDSVLRPVLGAIGERWSQLSFGIAVEHLLSHVASEVLGSLDDDVHTDPAPATAAILLACAPGELHDLPLVALDAALQAAGLSAARCPAPTPLATLDEAVSRHRRSVIALHALDPQPADPALFHRFPDDAALLALGPGWCPDRLPRHVTHLNTLAGAREHIAAAVNARLAEPSR